MTVMFRDGGSTYWNVTFVAGQITVDRVVEKGSPLGQHLLDLFNSGCRDVTAKFEASLRG